MGVYLLVNRVIITKSLQRSYLLYSNELIGFHFVLWTRNIFCVVGDEYDFCTGDAVFKVVGWNP